MDALNLGIRLEPSIIERYLLMCHRDGVEPSDVLGELIACIASGEPSSWPTEVPAKEFYHAFVDIVQNCHRAGFGQWLDRTGRLDADETDLEGLYQEYMDSPWSHQGTTFEGALSDLRAYQADRETIKAEARAYRDRAQGGKAQAVRLREAMDRAGIDARELADLLGVSLETFWGLAERMGDEFTVDELDRIAGRLHLTGTEINHIFFDA